MAMKRNRTLNIVVVMSGIPAHSTEWDLSCKYRDNGVSDIGSHYVILSDGDVIKPRSDEEHGNVCPRYNVNSVFIEVMGLTEDDITPQQKTALEGVVSVLEERFVTAEILPIY